MNEKDGPSKKKLAEAELKVKTLMTHLNVLGEKEVGIGE